MVSSMPTAEQWQAWVAPWRDQIVAFARDLIRIPSLSGQEDDLVRRVREEMESLGYDSVQIDEVGNVVGVLRGVAPGRRIMFNTHLDHVDPGDPAGWPHPPYGGDLQDGRIWGRGAVDIKGPLAAQVYGAALLRHIGLTFPGELQVVGAVMEEVGGAAGTRHAMAALQPDVAVLGEPSCNQLRRGHRGRVELVVRVTGRSAHASMPAQGLNPHYPVARFLMLLEQIGHEAVPEFGAATVAPTLYRTDQQSPNVIPGRVDLTLDWRTVPGQTAETVRQQLQQLLQQATVPEATGDVVLVSRTLTTWTGVQVRVQAYNPSYVIPADHPDLERARATLNRALGRQVDEGLWRFATDGGALAETGIAVIGFGPGDERLAHTSSEHIAVEELVEAAIGNAALALALTAAQA